MTVLKIKIKKIVSKTLHRDNRCSNPAESRKTRRIVLRQFKKFE